VEYWEIIADNLSKAGWSWGCVSALDGRPRTFDALRELCQKICHEKVTLDDGEVVTRLEVILRDWSESKDVQKQIALVQYGYGKPADKIELDELQPKRTLILHWPHEMPGWQPPDDWANHRSGRVFPRSLPDSASNGEGTRRPLLADAD